VVHLFGLSLIVISPEIFPDLTAFHPTFGSDMHFLCRSKNVALCKHEESRTDQTQEGISRCKVLHMVSTATTDLEIRIYISI
jgi:hypothetical protein